MLKLQWLRIQRFRSVRPGTRLEFSPGINVLLGRKDAGMTALLDLIAAVVSGDFTLFQDEEFELEYALTATGGTAVVEVWNEPRPGAAPSCTLTAAMTLTSHDDRLHFVIGVKGEDGRISQAENGEPVGEVVPVRLPNGAYRPGALASAGLTGWSFFTGQSLLDFVPLFDTQTRRIDDALERFDGLLSSRVRFTRGGYRAPGSMSVQSDPLIAFMIELRAWVREMGWGLEEYRLPFDRIPWLHLSVQALGFESAEVILRPQETGTRDADGPRAAEEWVELGAMRLRFVRPGGGELFDAHLDFGQKRVVAFMHAMLLARQVVVADTLAHGLTPHHLRACVDSLKRRQQSFLSSPDPRLLDALTFDSPEQVRSMFLLGRSEDTGEGFPWGWEPLSPEAAESLFTARQAGAEQVDAWFQTQCLG